MSYIEKMFDLKDTSAVVTGGAGVLPSVMAQALVNAGATVTIWGRGTSHPVDEAVKALKEETGVTDRIFGVTVDTSDEDAVSAAFEETCIHAPVPNLLINGVGGNKGKSDFTELDLDTFKEVIDMNLVGGLVVPTKIFVSKWRQEKMKGSIVNLASMSSYLPLSGVWAYNAAKSAVMNLTVGTADAFASDGIRVNAIAPGFFIGHQNRRLLIKDDATGELTDRGRQVIDHTPFGRFGDFSDMEGVTVFLASEAASGFITGVTIPVDGGYLTHNI